MKGRRKNNHWPAFVFLGAFIGFLIGFYSRDFLLPAITEPQAPPGLAFFWKSRYQKIFNNLKKHSRPTAASYPGPRKPSAQPEKKLKPETPAKAEVPAAKQPETRLSPNPPEVAFIIDDMGNNPATDAPFLDTPFPLAVSVLPDLPASKTVAEQALQNGKTLMLHLPLEADSNNQFLGPGALLVSMDDKTLEKQIEQDLYGVPGVEGINNHMGSKASADPRVARIVAQEAKMHHLFIVDSLTTPSSQLYRQARELDVPSAEREVFLDDVVKVNYIKGQVKELAQIARKKGEAIAIGHPHPETLQALTEEIPKIEKDGIQVVKVTRLLQKQ